MSDSSLAKKGVSETPGKAKSRVWKRTQAPQVFPILIFALCHVSYPHPHPQPQLQPLARVLRARARVLTTSILLRPPTPNFQTRKTKINQSG